MNRVPLAMAAVVLLSSACKAPATERPPVDATPSAALSPKRVSAGAPLAVQYSWEMGPQFARLSGEYRAYVHFVDDSGVILFTDDHVPTPPPGAWTRGERYSYRRIVLTSPFPYSGKVSVLMGLHPASGTGDRVPLRGLERGGHREYLVAEAELLRQDRALFPFCQGLSRPESDARAPFSVARFLEGDATCSFPNPKEDVVVVLESEAERNDHGEAPLLKITAGGIGAKVPVALAPDRTVVRLRIPAAALGPGPEAEMRLEALLPPSATGAGSRDDSRGHRLRVFGFVVARAGGLAPEVVDNATSALPLVPERQ